MKAIATFSLLLLCSVSLLAQSIITDNRTGCQVITENPSPALSVTWSGACEENWASGPGTLVWLYDGKNVAEYTGTLQHGLPHGKGKYTWSNGYVQEGNYFQGQFLNLDSTYLTRLEKVELMKQDKNNLYINDGNSQTLFYYMLKPKSEIKGALILLGGSTEPSNYVLMSTRTLTQRANDLGLAVIVPSINNNLWLGKHELSFLNLVFENAVQQYHLPKNKIIMGGFSLGGLYALRYAEMANDPQYKTAIRPVAVFAADPPLDMTWLYSVFQNEVKRNKSESAVAESNRYITAMETEFGSDPTGEKYKTFSAFSGSEKDGGNAKYLRNIPVRIYCDPDTEWQMKNRNVNYDEMGAKDQTAMIDLLNDLGNHNAEFVNALGKGYNPDSTRNPHSWSIIDANTCVDWMLRWLK
ncbi:MAG TPA: MORN repeat-containing protein [Cyclobacteriaceae bacterium]